MVPGVDPGGDPGVDPGTDIVIMSLGSIPIISKSGFFHSDFKVLFMSSVSLTFFTCGGYAVRFPPIR